MPANLNRKQQREIKAVVERAKKDNGIPQTAQQSIPFQRMFPDGICRVTDSYYTKTIQFQDINYQLAQQEDKTAIFDEWCSFLNFFDSSIHFELSFMNLSTDAESFEKSIRIPFKKDSFNPVRAEYSQMLKKQLAQGNNGLTKTKYLTFGIEAESMRQAKPRLNHIENDLLNNFRRLGVIATTMNGKERLHLMHSMFHMGDNDKFFFDWKYLVESGLSVKDFIAPTAFAFKTNRTFQMGSIFGSMSYLAITASDLSDRMLADFLDMESTQIVTMHIQSVDQTAAIKTIKRTITELDRSKIEEQKKAVRSGYDMDIIPSDLATYGKDAKLLLKELQSQNERMFMVTFLVLNTGRTEQELENNVFQAQSIAQKHNCNLRRLDFQQESGLMSSLPLAQNLIEIRRGLTTSSTAIFVPFTTQELFQNGGETLYYGLNALSNNLIMVDRKKLKNPNGLILGTPGSGKSFSAKREITNAFLVTDDDIIICDPEAEYAALVHKFNGQVVKISSSSTNYINPMDINLNYSEDDNPVALKADFILSLCELIMGSKDGLQPIEKTVIDRCVHQIYQRYFDNPAPENMPILEDLYDALLKQDEKEAHHVATALEIYGMDITVRPIEGMELSDLLKEAVSHIQGIYQAVELPEADKGKEIETIPATPDVKNFSYTVVDGNVYFRENSLMRRVDLNEKAKDRVMGMVELRGIVNQLIEYQLEDYPDEMITQKQAELNDAYDAFAAKNGLINNRANGQAFADDSSYYLLCSLENVDEDGNLKSKADMFTKRTIKPERRVTSVDTPSEALAISIGERGKVDLPFMAQLLGTPGEYDAIQAELRGVIFKDPMAPDAVESGWQTADEYLSGDVRSKLRVAQMAADRDSSFRINVEALQKAQPKDLDASEIDVRLGATWIDADYIQQFMEETFETPYYLRRSIEVKFSELTAEWRINGKSSPNYNDVAA